MTPLDIKSKIIAKRAEAAKQLENCSSSNPSDYRYIQGFIHCYDQTIGLINEMEKQEREDKDA